MCKPTLLDMFCGAGGAGMGYSLAGFDVTGVDINQQPHYQFKFIQGDCLALTLEFISGFDAIHASPPCQRYSRATKLHGNSESHPDLVAPIRAMLQASGKPWIIENVEGAPIRPDAVLCGTQFGLRIAKHRHFEASFPVFSLSTSCDHRDIYDPWHGAGRTAAEFRLVQGTPWIPMAGGASRKRGATGDLFNSIPPAFTEFLGRQMLVHTSQESHHVAVADRRADARD